MADFYSDDDEDLCPLCIEEMDISDKNFKPCPCGYQICQFCYNNIRNEANGRCPACRRIYDDESVEYKQISAEDIKKDHARQARRDKERRHREKQNLAPQEASKKHLAGMRVIQKNLVYVIGLNPNIATEDLHNTLRAEAFFGQYGKIQKIVINKRTNANGNLGLGVYVTFARKEDAARCINCVDGSLNDGKYLRAAYGTTKYCSSYLRGQICPNPNCMFLHEPGEDADSYTRRDLSAMQHRNPPPVVPPGLPSLTQATAPIPQIPAVSAAPLPTASAWRKPAPSTGPLSGAGGPSGGNASASSSTSNLASVSHVNLPQSANSGPAPYAVEETPEPVPEPVKFHLPSYKFSSPFVTSTSNIPHYFAFNLTSEIRLEHFRTHSSWLATVEEARVKEVQDTQIFQDIPPQSPQLPDTPSQSQAQPQPQPQCQPQGSSSSPPPQTTPPPGLFGNINSNQSSSRNSQELLAHLMKGKASSQKLNKQLNKYFERDQSLQGVVDVVKGAISKRSEPTALPEESQELETIVTKSIYIDDGTPFEAGDIPYAELVGDSEPSIWAGVEKHTRLEKQLEEAHKSKIHAQNTVKKLLRQASK